MTKEEVELAKAGITELRIGKARELAPERIALEKKALYIKGVAGAVNAFYHKRKPQHEICNIQISESKRTVTLTVNEKQENDTLPDVIESRFAVNEKLTELRINTGETYKPKELFAKLRRYSYFFVNQEIFKKILSDLIGFRAKIQAEVNDSDNRRGSSNRGVNKAVEYTLTDKFTLRMPIFEGGSPVEFEVEIEYNSDYDAFELFSMELDAKREENLKQLFAAEVEGIDCLIVNV